MRPISFDIRLRATAPAVPAEGLDHLQCPACGSRLAVHQPDPDRPARLLASCSCEECGAWFALVPAPGREVAYLVRVPAAAELAEAIARAGD